MTTRRQEQNRALKNVQIMADMMPHLLKEATHVILRNDFTSGQRSHESGELGDMVGTPGPHYGDPTGEEACWGELPDATGRAISNLCEKLTECLNSTLNIHDLSNTDVRVRAKRTMPDCLACGDPCVGRVLSGFDEKCYKRWTRGGRSDRMKFIAQIRAEREQSTDDNH